MPDDTLAPGLLILNRFRLKRMLGSGGMGSVWEASHLALGTEIAIKFLDAELSRRSDIRSRFAQEATAAARIKSANVVNVLDFGFTDGGRGFIVMERLCGEDLGQRLARAYTLTPDELAPVIAQACRGLGKAHALGIIHRDIKPENLFLNEEEDGVVVKVLDFGIAKHVEAAPSHRTDTGQLLGTPLYMSPEQALGRPLDTRTDLYSLALVAYRSLAGRPPFVHRATGELIVAVSTEVPPPPSSFNPSVPASLDAWFAAMLLKDPDARLCQTAASLAESFSAACRGSAPGAAASFGFSETLPGGGTPTLSEEAGSAARHEEPTSDPDGAVGTAGSNRAPARTRRRMAALLLVVASSALGLALCQPRPEPLAASAPPANPSEPANPGSPTGSAEPAQPRVPAHPSVPAGPSEPASRAPINVHLAAIPREAILYLDGIRLANNPIALSRPREPGARRLRAEAPGFESAERDIILDQDAAIELVLSPRSAPPEAELRASAPAAATAGAVTERSAPQPEERPRARSAHAPPPEAAPASSRGKRPLGIDRSNPWSSE